LEMFARAYSDADIEEPGSVTLPAAILANIVRRLPNEPIHIETSGNNVELYCAGKLFKLAAMSAENFPDWPAFKPETKITLRAADLARGLDSTMWAVAMRDPRRVLTGVMFELTGSNLTLTATDGRKLGRRTIEPNELIGPDMPQTIIPARFLATIAKAIGDEGEVKLDIASNRVAIECNGTQYLSSVIEGAYPKVAQVIPARFKRSVSINRDALADSVGSAGIMAERKFNSVALEFTGDGKLDISAQSFDEGSFSTSIAVPDSGKPYKIVFGADNLLGALAKIEDENVLLNMNEPSEPAVVKAESDPGAFYLVMPVRIHELEEAEDEDNNG